MSVDTAASENRLQMLLPARPPPHLVPCVPVNVTLTLKFYGNRPVRITLVGQFSDSVFHLIFNIAFKKHNKPMKTK